MKFWRRTVHEESEHKLLSLALNAEDGTTLMTFPGEVIESIRRTISRLITKKTLPARIALVSSLRQEGVTYLSRALATTLANDLDANVCVVELNWWWPDSSIVLPTDHSILESNRGLAGVLAEEIKLEQAILRTDRANLCLLPAGRMEVTSRPVLSRSTLLKEILYQLSEQYEYLVLDIPAVTATNDAIPLASLGDACCLVVHQGLTPIEKVRSTLDEIDHLTVLGVILNKMHNYTPSFLLHLIPQDAITETGVASG